jgi:hypothetical protein
VSTTADMTALEKECQTGNVADTPLVPAPGSRSTSLPTVKSLATMSCDDCLALIDAEASLAAARKPVVIDRAAEIYCNELSDDPVAAALRDVSASRDPHGDGDGRMEHPVDTAVDTEEEVALAKHPNAVTTSDLGPDDRTPHVLQSSVLIPLRAATPRHGQ